MATIIEKRRSLNKELQSQQQENDQLKSKLTKLQTLANLGTVSAIVAHEINNILMPLGNYAQLALAHPEDTELAQKALNKTVFNSARASEILESILAIVNGETIEKKTSILVRLIDEVFACIARDFEKDGITVKLKVPDDLEVVAVPVQLQQVLMNLILNAREAILPGNGILTICAENGCDNVRIEIEDSGCGIDAENLKSIFEPFFSTKSIDTDAKRNGAGVGLAFCKDIVDAHDGFITVESVIGKGTKFIVTLPQNNSVTN